MYNIYYFFVGSDLELLSLTKFLKTITICLSTIHKCGLTDLPLFVAYMLRRDSCHRIKEVSRCV